MPRSIWNGTITLGLTAVPIKVHSAAEDRSIHFHQVHAKDGARIRQKRICTLEGVEVPYEEVTKGYPLEDGRYVLLSNEEIASATGERSRVIELEEFVEEGAIDPVHYERGYYLGANRGGERAYRLLHDALRLAGRVGIGRWMFHGREYLVAIRAGERVLVMHTMVFADELVQARSLDIGRPTREPSEREIEMAEMLVEALHGEFEPTEYRDTHRERVLALIEQKAAGKEPELETAPAPEPAPDLMAALEASLKASGRKPGRRPRRTPAAPSSSPRSGSRR